MSLSIFPDIGGMAHGLYNLGRGRFKELVSAGKRIRAAKADDYGLVKKAVPQGETTGAAEEVIERNRDLVLAESLHMET